MQVVWLCLVAVTCFGTVTHKKQQDWGRKATGVTSTCPGCLSCPDQQQTLLDHVIIYQGESSYIIMLYHFIICFLLYWMLVLPSMEYVYICYSFKFMLFLFLISFSRMDSDLERTNLDSSNFSRIAKVSNVFVYGMSCYRFYVH